MTISKEALDKKIISFYIGDEKYYAYEGMTWEEWVESPFDIYNDFYETPSVIYHYNFDKDVCYEGSPVFKSSYIIEGYYYELI